MKKLAYLVSRYPAVSHTFIQREIQALRAHHLEIFTASINPPDIKADQISAVDEAEIAQTFYVKKAGTFNAIRALFTTLFTHPILFFRGLFFSLKHATKGFLYSLFYFTEAILVGKWMTEKEISHLHVHFANPASTVALIMTKIFPHTFSMTIHGPDEFYDVTLNLLPEKIQAATFIHCISFYTQSQLMRLVPLLQWKKFKVTRLGVDPQIYFPTQSKENHAPLQILSVGRLSPNKGHAILIQAFHLLKSESPSLQLKIVGDGPELSSLQQLIHTLQLGDSVHLTGALNQQQTLETYREADLFVLASFAEGLPVALMEAMSLEIPCIATNINAIPELIQQGINGLLVPSSDVDSLAQSMKLLIETPSLRIKLGQAGRQTVIEKYNLAKNIEALANRYRT